MRREESVSALPMAVPRMPDWLERQAATRPGHTAVLVGDRAISFAALAARVGQTAARLDGAGAEKKVGFVLGNGLPLVELVLACLRSGRTAVLFDPRLGEAELRRLADATDVPTMVCGVDLQETTRAVAAGRSVLLWEDLCAKAARPTAAPGIDLSSEAVVIFSSGTGGRSRPISLTAGNFLWSALSGAARLGSHPDDRWLACLPMSHVGGLSILLRSILLGTTMILHERFDVGAVRRSLSEEGTSLVSLVPTTLARLLEGEAPIGAPRLRCALIGGAGASMETLEKARSQGLEVCPTYGATETCSQIATLAPGEDFVEAGFVGAPLLHTSVRVAGPSGEILAHGQEVTLEIFGPTVSPSAAGEGGWFRSGDVGRLDDAGRLTVLGRRDDVIVTGGENVSPSEVEAVLLGIDTIAEVAVGPVSDPRWGQAVAAWVVPAAGCSVELEAVRESCAPLLAPHKRPQRLTVMDALPRTALGKVRRAELPGIDRREAN